MSVHSYYFADHVASSPSSSDLELSMDELEQRCYDLDVKVRRVEDERDALVNENEDLQEQVSHT